MIQEEARIEIEGFLFRGETFIFNSENPKISLEAILEGMEVFEDFQLGEEEWSRYFPGMGDGYGFGFGFGKICGGGGHGNGGCSFDEES